MKDDRKVFNTSANDSAVLRQTFRGLVYSIRPTIARSVGLPTVLDDLLTTDGVLAWDVGLQVLQSSAGDSSLGPTVAEWSNAELNAERRRWRTLHVLAESLESRLGLVEPHMDWSSSTANTLAFAQRIRQGEAVLTSDVAERLCAIIQTLSASPDAGHWESLDALVKELNVLVDAPIHQSPDDAAAPSLFNADFAGDIVVWLSANTSEALN